MLMSSLAPYLHWAKSRAPAAIDLAGSNLLHCALSDLPGARDAVDLAAPNDNGYAPLVESIARHYAVAPDRVVTAGGCSGANFLAAAALVGPGDDVLVEHPTYDPLIGICRLMGARVIRFPRRFEHGWQCDPDEVKGLMTPHTRLIIVTSPHNPTGTHLEPSRLEALGVIAEHAHASVLVDEVYLDGANMVSGIAGRAASAAQSQGPFVVTSSLTKSYGLAGLRTGWAICRPEIAERLRRTRDVVDNAGSAPADRLAAFAFTHLPALSSRAGRILGDNTRRARAFFDAHPTLEVAAPASCSVIFPRLAGIDDAGPFVERVLEEAQVALAPGRFFEAPAHFRISLAGRSELLEEGLTRISEVLGRT